MFDIYPRHWKNITYLTAVKCTAMMTSATLLQFLQLWCFRCCSFEHVLITIFWVTHHCLRQLLGHDRLRCVISTTSHIYLRIVSWYDACIRCIYRMKLYVSYAAVRRRIEIVWTFSVRHVELSYIPWVVIYSLAFLYCYHIDHMYIMWISLTKLNLSRDIINRVEYNNWVAI